MSGPITETELFNIKTDCEILAQLEPEIENINERIAKYQAKIEEHMTEVIKMICSIYGDWYYTWYFPDAEEGEMGTFKIVGDNVPIIVEARHGLIRNIYKKFPTHFLSLTIEEIKKEIERPENDSYQRIIYDGKKNC